MQSIPFNGYSTSNPFTTAANAQQDFEMRKALAAQQLQTGGIDAQTKMNAYKTQILAGAVAGGQPAYDQARQTLQNQGIDTSEFAPDVQTAATQVNAARLAQAPAMQLLNTAIQANRNGIEASAQTGNTPPPLVIPGLTAATSVPISSPPVATKPNLATQVQAGTPAGNQAMSDMYDTPAQPVVLPGATDNTPPATISPNMTPAQAKAVPMPVAQNTNLPGGGNAVAGTSIPPFVPPPNDPSKNLQWNQDNYKNSLDTYNNRTDVIAAKGAAGESGKASVEYGEKAAAATELVGRIDKNLDAMLNVNPDVPQSRWGVDSASKAWLSQNFGDQDTAAAYGAFSKVNKAQVLNGIQELVQSGSIRNSKALISLVADVNAIDQNAAPAIRAQQIGAVRAELHNLATSASNINARMTGGQTQPYENIPTTANQAANPPPPGGTLYGTSGGKPIYKMQDGTFLMSQ